MKSILIIFEYNSFFLDTVISNTHHRIISTEDPVINCYKALLEMGLQELEEEFRDDFTIVNVIKLD